MNKKDVESTAMFKLDAQVSDKSCKLEDVVASLADGKTDFFKFYQSDDYRMLADQCGFDNKYLLRGIRFKLNGDIDSIHWGSKNRLVLNVCINNYPDVVSSVFMVSVRVPTDMYNQVQAVLKPDLRLSATVVYKVFEFSHIFELVSIDAVDSNLLFPYCICTNPNCKADFGISVSDRESFCPICGGRTKLISNIWEYMARNK